MRCDENEIDLSTKENKIINANSSDEGIDMPYGDGDQRPTNPDSSEISRTQSQCDKFKKDDFFECFDKL